MAYYLVKARVQQDRLTELKARLDQGEILTLHPFGQALDHSLKHARIDSAGWVVWEEEDYCQPPLAMERAAVLDTYFTDLSVTRVEHKAGWQQIEHLPYLWPES